MLLDLSLLLPFDFLYHFDDAPPSKLQVGTSGGRISNPLPEVHDPLCRSTYTTSYAYAAGEIRTPDPLVRSEVLSIH